MWVYFWRFWYLGLFLVFTGALSAQSLDTSNSIVSGDEKDPSKRAPQNPMMLSSEISDADKIKKLRELQRKEREEKLKERLGERTDSKSSTATKKKNSRRPGAARSHPDELADYEESGDDDLLPLSTTELTDEESTDAEGDDSRHESLTKARRREAPSRLESIFQGHFPMAISQHIEQFGYALFQNKSNDFSPLEDIPISPDYIVGPGDTFTVNVSGGANLSHLLTVRRDGTVFIPKIGNLRVWGDSFKVMASKIERRLSSFYSGIKVDFGFERIRSIDVFVVGEVSRPGAYTVPSTSTVLNVLFHAAGPTKNGSLRHIQLLRNNQIVTTLDLYDFLISGKMNNQKLQSQDVIMVPVIGRVAAVSGHVKRPAIYELPQEQADKESTNLFDLLTLAGGLSFTGEAGRLELQRIRGNQERVTQDIQLSKTFATMTRDDAVKSPLKEKVLDGDILKVFPVLPSFKATVFLKGHVKRPGAYEFRAGMRVTDLIPRLDLLKPEPYVDFVQIVRTVPPQDNRSAVFVQLQKALDGDLTENIELQDQDQVYVFSREELNLREKVEISGKVNRPGTYFHFEGMRLRDLILMAGNLVRDASLGEAEVARYQHSGNDIKPERLRIRLKDALAGLSEANIVLQPLDKIFIQGVSNSQTKNQIAIQGEVKFPGTYTFLPGERLSSALERAGGPLSTAFLPGAVFTRLSVRDIQERTLKQEIAQLEEAILHESLDPGPNASANDVRSFQEASNAKRTMLRNLREAEVTGRMVIHLSSLNDFKGSAADFPLESQDSLLIPRIPSVVTVMGEVYNPTALLYMPDRDVQHYLDKSGGPTMNADRDSILIIKADGSLISRKQNRGFLLRNFLQMKLERGDTILVPKDISNYSWLAFTKDITDVLFKIASTTGITIQAFR